MSFVKKQSYHLLFIDTAKRSMTLEMEQSLLTTKNGFFLHSILSKKENDTEENEEEETQRKEEKTRETIWKRKDEKQKTVFKPDIQDVEQINIRDSAQRTSWLAMAKSNPRRSRRRRRRTKRLKEKAAVRKAAGAFNPKTGLEIPNLKPGPEREGSEPNHSSADDGCELKPEPSFLGFIGVVTKGTRV